MIVTIISFLPFMVCLFWFVTFAIRTKKNDGAKNALTVFLAVCAVLYLCHAIYFNGGLSLSLNCIWALCSLSAYPLYYIYIHILTSGSKKESIPMWVLIPGAAVALFMYLLPGNASELARKALFFLQVVGVCWLGTKRLQKFDREISSNYADTEGLSVSDVRALLVAFVVTSVFSAIANAVGKQFFAESNALLSIVAIVFATMLYIISYLGFNRSFTYDKMAQEIPEDKHEEHKDEDDSLGCKIEYLMSEKKIFLQKGLTIADLVQQAGSCRTYISNYINQSKGMSFSDYINTLRIEEAKTILQSDQNIKLVSLSDRLGFTSEQSFYRNFKKFTGLTPAQWKKQNSHQ